MESNQTILLYWHRMPGDTRQEVFKRLKRPEILYFRAVCKTFRNTLPLPAKPISPHPDLVIPFCVYPKSSSHRKLSLTISTVYAIQPIEATNGEPTNTWIVRLEELSSGVVRVKDSLYRFGRRDVSDQLPRSLNLLDYRVQELSKVYGLAPAGSEDGKRYATFKKVVLSSYLDEFDSGFTLLALCGKGKIIAWREGDQFWKNIRIEGVNETPWFEDVVYYNNKFYAVFGSRRVATVDPKTLTATEMKYRIAGYKTDSNGRNFLVKSSKDLFWICMYVSFLWGTYAGESDEDYRTHVEIIKLDEKSNQWINARDGDELKDEVLFIGDGFSFSFQGKGCTPCELHSIYFIDDEELSKRGYGPGRDIGIYNVGTAFPLAKPIFEFPGYSKLFWPPPIWLNQNQSSTYSV